MRVKIPLPDCIESKKHSHSFRTQALCKAWLDNVLWGSGFFNEVPFGFQIDTDWTSTPGFVIVSKQNWQPSKEK